MHDPTSVVKPTWPYSQSGQGTHAPPFPIVEIPHITGSSPLPNPPISGAGVQTSHSSVQIPHITGRFGHWAPQPAKHLPDYQGGRGHMHRHSL